MSKYEKMVFKLFILAFLLLILSWCPCGYQEVTGILQGLGTGLLSGIVLLFVTGIKSKEHKQLTKAYNAIHESNLALSIINQSYGNIIMYPIRWTRQEKGIA